MKIPTEKFQAGTDGGQADLLGRADEVIE